MVAQSDQCDNTATRLSPTTVRCPCESMSCYCMWQCNWLKSSRSSTTCLFICSSLKIVSIWMSSHPCRQHQRLLLLSRWWFSSRVGTFSFLMRPHPSTNRNVLSIRRTPFWFSFNTDSVKTPFPPIGTNFLRVEIFSRYSGLLSDW